MRLVVGLGNPGRRYELSRHNVGFRCLDELARRWGVAAWRRAFGALVGAGYFESRRLLLAKPQTFMNLSGEAVGPLLRYFGLVPGEMLVIYDDMDLPLGKLRIRLHGSSGGHRGVESIIAALGTNQFPRLRIGIGRGAGLEAADYVLGRFGEAEEPVVAEALTRAADAVEMIVRDGLAAAMNRYNA